MVTITQIDSPSRSKMAGPTAAMTELAAAIIEVDRLYEQISEARYVLADARAEVVRLEALEFSAELRYSVAKQNAELAK